MGSLNADNTYQKGSKRVITTAVDRPSAIDLIAALDAVDVVGPQMFERDCLGYTFDLWSQSQSGSAVGEHTLVTTDDILADIADIRAISTRHPEVTEIDGDLLNAVAAVEAHVLLHLPTIQ
jgi:hypothetical protein